MLGAIEVLGLLVTEICHSFLMDACHFCSFSWQCSEASCFMKQWYSEMFNKWLQVELVAFEHQQGLSYYKCTSSPAGIKKTLGPQLGLDMPNLHIVWPRSRG